MSIVGYDPRSELIPSSVARNLARAIQDREKTVRKKTPGLVQYPEQVDRSHSLGGTGNGEGHKNGKRK